MPQNKNIERRIEHRWCSMAWLRLTPRQRICVYVAINNNSAAHCFHAIALRARQQQHHRVVSAHHNAQHRGGYRGSLRHLITRARRMNSRMVGRHRIRRRISATYGWAARAEKAADISSK